MKKIRVLLVAVSLVLAGAAPALAQTGKAETQGTKCSKVGNKRTVKGTFYVCTMTAKGMFWYASSAKAHSKWTKSGSCQTNNIWVNPPVKSSRGAFTHRPFDMENIKIIVNGGDGASTDSRFAYVTISSPNQRIPLYAPAPMVLVKIRPKDTASVPNLPMRETDWDLTFAVSCDTQVRINHITEPSERVKSAWGHPGKFATWWLPDGTQVSNEERQVPTKEIVFRAGEIIGYTQGTLLASNFDYVVGINNKSVCPWSVFDEPLQTSIMSKLGPPPLSAFDGPVPGYPCRGYGGNM